MNNSVLNHSRRVRLGSTTLLAKITTWIFICALSVIGSSCQRADNNANSNLTANANTSPIATNSNLAAAPPSVIAAREPDKYRATLVFSAETEGGQKTVGIPTLSAEVARNGADRRVAFKLPDGSDLIYLEQGDARMAQSHFESALRIEPNDSVARDGLNEAIKQGRK